MPTTPPTGANLPNPPSPTTTDPLPDTKPPGFGPIFNHIVNLFLSNMTPIELMDTQGVEDIMQASARAAMLVLSHFQRYRVQFSIPQSPNPWPK